MFLIKIYDSADIDHFMFTAPTEWQVVYFPSEPEIHYHAFMVCKITKTLKHFLSDFKHTIIKQVVIS